MASYETILSQVKENIIGGVLAKDAIYIIAEDRNYNLVVGYIPNIREKGNEWISFGANDSLKATTFSQGGFSFIGASDEEVCQITDISDFPNSFGEYENEKLYLLTHSSVIGDKLYFSQGDSIFKFVGNQKWTNIFDNEKERKGKNGFIYSFDGFSDNEIYIGGDKGEIWLFNGNTWQELEIPTNQWIPNIVCAPNGNVYLNARGKIIIGRKDNWEKSINTGEAIEKIVWFQGKLYLLPQFASSTGLFVLENDEIKPVEVGHFSINVDDIKDDDIRTAMKLENTEVKVHIPAGNTDMFASEDLLMITGDDRVILFDGTRWFNLFDKNKTEEELRENGTFYDPREL